MKFVSNRDIVVRSKSIGQSIAFKKGVPTNVPLGMREEVLEKGILPVTDDGKSIDVGTTEVVQEEKKVVLAPEDAHERVSKIIGVIKAIVSRNNAKDFTAGGVPNAQSVTVALGWKVDQKEVRQVWDKHRETLIGDRSQLAA